MKVRILALLQALREAGVRLSPAESIDALRAVALLGLDREALRTALQVTTIKDPEDCPTFDRLFDHFFPRRAAVAARGKRPRTEPSEGQGTGGGKTEGAGSSSPPRSQDQEAPPARRPGDPARPQSLAPGPQPSVESSAPSGEVPRGETRLADQSWERVLPTALDGEPEFLSRLSRQFLRRCRRMRKGKREHLDFRRTIRASVEHGGLPLQLAWRQRRRRPLHLVALCDLSWSVSVASEFLLRLLVPADRFFRSVQCFGFVDDPVPVSVEQGRLTVEGHLDLHARSDFGRVLRSFEERHGRLVHRQTVLLVLGDARNNRRPPRADILRKLRLRARFLLWINPEDRQHWNRDDSVWATYARQCDLAVGARTPRELSAVLERLLRRHN